MKAAAQTRNAVIWTLLGVVSLFMIAAPSVWDLDMASGGGALIFLGITGAICSVLVARMYFKRASTLFKMQSRENLLVEWDLPANGGKTLISMDGIVTKNILYNFRDVVCSLREVELKPSPESPRRIVLTIEVPKHEGTKLDSLDIQIPEGQADTARQAADKLRARYLGKGAG